MDRTIAELDGVHFDIPDPVKRVEAMIAEPGGAAAMYYTGPSEDFSRPGRTWYPTLGRTRFPLWGEVSICYHEGVPGHHLQVGQVRYLADQLNRYQRTLGWVSGHGEGWALYAERLMGELGYLDEPDYELGMLRAQAMRAVRVVVDIGMHLELPIPDARAVPPGRAWTPELALPFVIERSMFPEDFMRSEVDRYLGLPGPGDLLQGRRAGVARVPRRRPPPPRRRLRPQGLAPLRPRPRQHGPRPAPTRARPLLRPRSPTGRLCEFASQGTASAQTAAGRGSGLEGAVGPGAVGAAEPPARGEAAAVGVDGRAGDERRRGRRRGRARRPRCRPAVPNRPTGTHCGMSSCCSSGTQREYGTWIDSMRSGAIAFTRTPSLPSSTARLFVNCVIAPLKAL